MERISFLLIPLIALLLFTGTAKASMTVWDELFARNVLSPWVVTAGNPVLQDQSLYFNSTGDSVIHRDTGNISVKDFDFGYSFNIQTITNYPYFESNFIDTKGDTIVIRNNIQEHQLYIRYWNGTNLVSQTNTYGSLLTTDKWYYMYIQKTDNRIFINMTYNGTTLASTFIESNDLANSYINRTYFELYQNTGSGNLNIFVDDNLFRAYCFDINTAGQYTMNMDTTLWGGTNCMGIRTSNVILDFDNYTMFACGDQFNSGCGNGYGLQANNVNNVTLLNGKIVGWTPAITLNNLNGALSWNMNTVGVIDCNNCQNTQFVGSIIQGNDLSPSFSGNSAYNIIGNAGFYNAFGLMVFYGTSHNNLVCNVVYGTPPFFIQYDSSIDNTYTANCPPSTPPLLVTPPCASGFNGWQCTANNTLSYVDVWCNFNNQTFCQFGCAAGQITCNGPPSAGIMNNTPYTNLTSVLPPGTEWVNYFFTPAILISLVVFGVAAIVASKIGGQKKGVVFLVATTLMFLVLTITGTLPLWVLIIIGIIGGVFGFVLIKNKGE